jgi:large subunit ribosomal protein LP1
MTTNLSAQQKKDAAVAYAVLLLKDAQKDITSANITSLADAAGVKIEKLYSEAYAKVLSNSPQTVANLINRMSAVGAGSGGGAAPTTGSAPKVEEKKEEVKEETESEEDIGFGGLF